MCLMSMRIERARRKMRMRWGAMSSGGTGIGNCMKTGSKAVEIGIASSMLDGWCVSKFATSLVVNMSVKNVKKRASSRYTYVRRAVSEPAENQFEVRGKSSWTPSALLGRVG